MAINWDPIKARSNLRKHGVRFADAEGVLSDPMGLTVRDDSISSEERFVTLGEDSLGRLMVVVYAHLGEDIRIISVRRATRNERVNYEEGI